MSREADAMRKRMDHTKELAAFYKESFRDEPVRNMDSRQREFRAHLIGLGYDPEELDPQGLFVGPGTKADRMACWNNVLPGNESR